MTTFDELVLKHLELESTNIELIDQINRMDREIGMLNARCVTFQRVIHSLLQNHNLLRSVTDELCQNLLDGKPDAARNLAELTLPALHSRSQNPLEKLAKSTLKTDELTFPPESTPSPSAS